MRFSARSFTDAARARAAASSSSSQRPRGLVPFMGRVVTRVPRLPKKSSGEAERIRCLPRSRYAP